MNYLILFLTLFQLLSLINGQCSATLRRGGRGDCVKVIQRKVGVEANGNFDANTENAVRRFQQSNGLSADGIVGQCTWAAVYATTTGQQGGRCDCSAQGAAACSEGPTLGACRLAEYLKQTYGGRTEIYNCRTIRGSSSKSLHGEGRAVDLYVTGSTGDAVFRDMQRIACTKGIQEVIFNRQIWTKSGGVHAYTGQNPHADHVHVGLNKCGANNFKI